MASRHARPDLIPPPPDQLPGHYVGHGMWNGQWIPRMNLGTRVIHCDLRHRTDEKRCLSDHVVAVVALGSHRVWEARSILGSRQSDHPIKAFHALVEGAGYTVLKAELEKKGECVELNPISVAE
jgi:hypothetical protein